MLRFITHPNLAHASKSERVFEQFKKNGQREQILRDSVDFSCTELEGLYPQGVQTATPTPPPGAIEKKNTHKTQ